MASAARRHPAKMDRVTRLAKLGPIVAKHAASLNPPAHPDVTPLPADGVPAPTDGPTGRLVSAADGPDSCTLVPRPRPGDAGSIDACAPVLYCHGRARAWASTRHGDWRYDCASSTPRVCLAARPFRPFRLCQGPERPTARPPDCATGPTVHR